MRKIDNNADYTSFLIEEIKKPAIEVFRNSHMTQESRITDCDSIIFIAQGVSVIHYAPYPETMLSGPSFFFIPYGSSYEIKLPQETYMVIIRLHLYDQISRWEKFGKLKENINESTLEIPTLFIKDILYKYLESLSFFLDDGVLSKAFYKIKVEELFLILNEYYTEKELAQLFRPILNRDFVFADFILKNWQQVKNVRELAERSVYCESVFNRKFKKAFGVTPHKWLNKKKSAHILNELKYGNKSFKQISDDFSFNSIQQFNSYCLRNFKETPGKIRKTGTRKMYQRKCPGRGTRHFLFD